MAGLRSPGGDPSARPSTTRLTVIARAIVESSDASGALVLATTDAVDLSSNAPELIVGAERARSIVGRRVRLRIAPDGAARIVDGEGVPIPRMPGVVRECRRRCRASQ